MTRGSPRAPRRPGSQCAGSSRSPHRDQRAATHHEAGRPPAASVDSRRSTAVQHACCPAFRDIGGRRPNSLQTYRLDVARDALAWGTRGRELEMHLVCRTSIGRRRRLWRGYVRAAQAPSEPGRVGDSNGGERSEHQDGGQGWLEQGGEARNERPRDSGDESDRTFEVCGVDVRLAWGVVAHSWPSQRTRSRGTAGEPVESDRGGDAHARVAGGETAPLQGR